MRTYESARTLPPRDDGSTRCTYIAGLVPSMTEYLPQGHAGHAGHRHHPSPPGTLQ
jgi:hypothetical protein